MDNGAIIENMAVGTVFAVEDEYAEHGVKVAIKRTDYGYQFLNPGLQNPFSEDGGFPIKIAGTVFNRLGALVILTDGPA